MTSITENGSSPQGAKCVQRNITKYGNKNMKYKLSKGYGLFRTGQGEPDEIGTYKQMGRRATVYRKVGIKVEVDKVMTIKGTWFVTDLIKEIK